MVKGQVGDPVKQRTTVIVSAPPKITPTVPGEADAVRDAIHRYEEAYRTMVISEVKKEYPSASKKYLDATKDVFKQFKAPKVQIDCKEIVVNGDSAVCTGNQTFTYTEGGKPHVPCTSNPKPGCIPPAPVHVQLKKTGGAWHIDDIS